MSRHTWKFYARLCTATHSGFLVAAAPKSDVMQGRAESVTLPTCTSPDSLSRDTGLTGLQLCGGLVHIEKNIL